MSLTRYRIIGNYYRLQGTVIDNEILDKVCSTGNFGNWTDQLQFGLFRNPHWINTGIKEGTSRIFAKDEETKRRFLMELAKLC